MHNAEHLPASGLRVPELLPHFQDGVSSDNEHLRHVVCQHLAGIANVHGRLYQERMQELQTGPQQGQRTLLPHARTQRGCVRMQFPLPCSALTLFVSSQHPNLDVGECQEGNGLRDSLLKLILNGRCPQQLETPQSSLAPGSRARALLAHPWPTLRPVPSCRSQPPHRHWPAGPPGCPGPGWLGVVSQPTPHSTLRPGPCRPVPGSSAPPLHIPRGRAERVTPLPPAQHREEQKHRALPSLTPTFRWSVVVWSRSRVEWWSLSSRRVSAPLQ